MGCGIADFGRRGLKTPQTQFFGVLSLPPGTSTRSATWDLDSQRQRFPMAKNLEFGAFLGPSGQNHQYHTPLLFKIWDLTKNKKIVNDPFNGRIPFLVFWPYPLASSTLVKIVWPPIEWCKIKMGSQGLKLNNLGPFFHCCGLLFLL